MTVSDPFAPFTAVKLLLEHHPHTAQWFVARAIEALLEKESTLLRRIGVFSSGEQELLSLCFRLIAGEKPAAALEKLDYRNQGAVQKAFNYLKNQQI